MSAVVVTENADRPVHERGGQRRSWRRIAAAAVLVVVVAGAALAYLLTRSADAAMAMRFTPGQTLRYGVDLSVSGTTSAPGGSLSPYDLHVRETLAWRVTSVDARGVATVRLTVQGATLTLNGRSSPGGSGVSTEVRVAPDGRIVSTGDPSVLWGGRPGAGVPGLDQLVPLLPARQVAPGESWSRAFDQAFAPGRGALRYSTTTRFERFQNSGGVRAAEIRSAMSVPVDVSLTVGTVPGGFAPTIDYVGQSSVNQTAWFDPKQGELVGNASQGELAMTLTFTAFPSLFPTFTPVGAPSVGTPFGGGPGGSGGVQGDTLELKGRFVLHLQRLP